MNHYSDLAGKVVIVTGSTSGIGEASAKLLASHGMYVVVSGRSQERGNAVVNQIKEAGGVAIFVEADLNRSSETAAKLVQSTAHWGRIDAIVNNAAMICHKPLEQVEEEDWDQLFTVNLKSAFMLVRAALPALIASKGSILNISSTNAWINCPDNIVYDTMKAALNHMTRSLSQDLLKHGIRVNALMPGGTESRMMNDWLKLWKGDEQAAHDHLDKSVADGSMGQPEQIAEGVLFLLSSQSRWVNGALIPIDGGYHIR